MGYLAFLALRASLSVTYVQKKHMVILVIFGGKQMTV